MVVKPVHCGSSSILKVFFFWGGTPCIFDGNYNSSNYCSGVPDLAKEWLGTEAERCPGGRREGETIQTGGEKGEAEKWRREWETIQNPLNFVRLHLIGVGGVSVGEVMPAPDGSCRVGVFRARRGEGGKKRRKVVLRVSLNGIVLT